MQFGLFSNTTPQEILLKLLYVIGMAMLKGVEKETKNKLQIRESALNQCNLVTLRQVQLLLVNCFKDCEFDIVNISFFKNKWSCAIAKYLIPFNCDLNMLLTTQCRV